MAKVHIIIFNISVSFWTCNGLDEVSNLRYESTYDIGDNYRVQYERKAYENCTKHLVNPWLIDKYRNRFQTF